MSKEHFDEQNPHYEYLDHYQVKIRDEMSYLGIDKRFKINKKQLKKKGKKHAKK